MNEILIPSIYCFIFLYIIRFIIVIRREDWFLVWMGLEINIISFLILIYRRYRVGVIESCLKYFFIQSLGSVLFIRIFYLNYYILGGILFLILRFKIGAGPFFYWFPSICSGIEWNSCYILIIYQKILPLLLIRIFIHWILWFVVIISLMIGVLGSFNQNNIKQLIAYSSIHHLGWIIIIIMGRKSIRWILYLGIYMLVLFSVVGLLLKDDIIDLSSIYISKNKFMFIIGILRIAGMPPLLGFFLKWIALVRIIEINIIYIIILIIVSITILYVYIRIVYDVFIGGGIERCEDYILFYKISNIEILSIVGIVIGIIVGIIMII